LAAPRRKGRPEGLGGLAVPRSRASLLGTTAIATTLTLLAATVSAHAGQKPVLPQGGSFVAGSGAIAGTGNALTITQTSLRGIIDWSSFSIGRGYLVQFQNGSGATLNRVTGTQQSWLAGTLSASGSVYLINPNGVLIGKNGVIKIGGSFVASTLDTPDAAFMQGGALTLSGSSSA
jgi:filamentous hemagglutinin family protein